MTERMADVTSAPIPPVRPRRQQWRPGVGHLRRLVFVVVLSVLSLVFIYPFLWAVSASLKPREDVFNNRVIPANWAPENYDTVWDATQMLTWMLNSLQVGFLAAGAVTLSSALVAFGFAYFRFPGRSFLFGLVLATMMLPFAVTMIPVFLIWNELGLVNTKIPLWAMNLFGSAFYIFLLRQFFLGIPRELFEAARVDGDNFFTMFWRIAMPLAKPALVVAFIFELQASWNDLIKPLIYLQDPNLYTIPLGLKSVLDGFGQSGEMQWEIVIAATVIATIPMIVIFFLGQRYFVEGIAAAGRKG
ncbi:MAG TPA: carbohydrate ABC transporter permease [Gaiellaceae bacterium]|jgi:multiple sugar transport system permease protein|nr:carbohydrate ABC transporter permease [Gaiellaceae bacterium]